MTTGFSAGGLSEFFGTLFLCAAGVLAVLIFVDRWTDIAFPFPSFWFTSRNFHVACCVVSCAFGWFAHRHATSLRQGQPAAHSVFQTVVVYTQPDCPLCERAFEVLSRFSRSLPTIQAVDITGQSELIEQHSQSVPVVEIDGRVRFRGVVNAELLKRLIEARQTQRNADDAAGCNLQGLDT